jgi:formamidase
VPYVLTLAILVITCSSAAQWWRCSPQNWAFRIERQGTGMTGLGGLNKSPTWRGGGAGAAAAARGGDAGAAGAQTERIVWMVGKARRNQGTMDLVVFPEYALHGLSMRTDPELMCTLDGPEVAVQGRLCRAPHLGLLLDHGAQPRGQPVQHRPDHRRPGPGQAVLPQAAPLGAGGALGARQHGRAGVRRAQRQQAVADHLPRRHVPRDGARGAYKGAEIILRTAGYTAPIRHAWKITNQANAFQNLAYTASVCLCGSDGSFDSMGEGMFCNFDGTVLAEGGGRVDEIITAELRPDLVREARAAGAWRTTPTSCTTAAMWR